MLYENKRREPGDEGTENITTVGDLQDDKAEMSRELRFDINSTRVVRHLFFFFKSKIFLAKIRCCRLHPHQYEAKVYCWKTKWYTRINVHEKKDKLIYNVTSDS